MKAAPYKDFAARLHEALDHKKFDSGRRRTGALSIKYAVSRETARKWLSGLALPEMERLIAIARDFNVAFEWLATGRGAREVQGVQVNEERSEYMAEDRVRSGDELQLLKRYRASSEEKRKAMLALLR